MWPFVYVKYLLITRKAQWIFASIATFQTLWARTVSGVLVHYGAATDLAMAFLVYFAISIELVTGGFDSPPEDYIETRLKQCGVTDMHGKYCFARANLMQGPSSHK